MTGALLRNRTTFVAPKLLRMGNVGYAVSLQDENVPGSIPIGEAATIFDRPARVLKLPAPLPPAWVVGGSRPAASPSAALLAIAEPGFEPAAEVILGKDSPRRPPPEDFHAQCTIRERRADRLVADVEASAAGHLVVAEAYQEGWRATVDGAATPVMPANVLFRAVVVPPGSHRLELRYRPPAVFWGAGITAAGLATLIMLTLRRER